MAIVCSERELAALSIALGARSVKGWSLPEEALCRDLPPVSRAAVETFKRLIMSGRDPLGDAYGRLRSAESRRPYGATYTPKVIVSSMISWARTMPEPERIVDPGLGSGRFLVAAGRCFPNALLVGIELDPLGALLARGHLAASGLAKRSQVLICDYRAMALDRITGRTLFVGNPPYVRHHLIDPVWKTWLVKSARSMGMSDASQLAGLHVHFVVATLSKAQRGDFGAFITAAEWLDVNYGKLLRDLFVGPLGGRSVTLIEPTAQAFPDAATTAAITCFEVGTRAKSIGLRRVGALSALKNLPAGRLVRRERLESAARWTPLTRGARRGREGFVELGELCRVHRGQVTGANKVWIAGHHSLGLPDSVLFPCVTRARELFAAGVSLDDASSLRRVVDLPVELDTLRPVDRSVVDSFLRRVKSMGGNKGYVAENRRAWWSVGLREPAPILATYMARRPPAFVRNAADARHINIAHGIYPREPLAPSVLDALASYLRSAVSQHDGRTYAGGLTKFEPKEMERLLVPSPSMLDQPDLESAQERGLCVFWSHSLELQLVKWLDQTRTA